MLTNGVFAKHMARELDENELEKVGGGATQTFYPNTCHVSGGTDGVWESDSPFAY